MEKGKEIRSSRLEDTERAAQDFVCGLQKGERALVFGLEGDLGSGKTTFAKGVAKALGVEQTVTSPTFVIEKIYKLVGQNFSHLIHIDAYRLEDAKELNVLGFDDVLADKNNLVVVEWPEHVEGALPKDTKIINFSFVDDETRLIQFPVSDVKAKGHGKD